MKPEELLGEDELKNVLEVNTDLILPDDGENKVVELKGIKDYPRCESCGWYELRDDAKGYCRNVDGSRTVWIEDMSAPPLTVTKYFGCIEHTTLKEK